ncbi:MAG: O-antigen ligase family protein [Chloroflexia bacterium]
MQSKLAIICDRVIEAGWLAALVFTPIYFNVYSSRVFEPDKISMLRNIVLMMTLAWLIKLIEGALNPRNAGRRVAGALGDAAPRGIPALLRVPMMVPLLLYAFLYLFSTITSVVPLTAFFGSYQRMQGLISQYSYIMVALLIIANMRSRAQLNRLITFAIVTSFPVAAYGILQFTGRDPLPWAGDVQTRVASTLGNAIFVAAFLIMVVPLTLQRLLLVVQRLRGYRDETPSADDPNDDPVGVAIIGGGAVLLLTLIQYAGITTGNKIVPSGPSLQIAQGQSYNDLGDWLIWGGILLAGVIFAWIANTTVSRTRYPAAPGEEEYSVPIIAKIAIPIVQLAVLMLGIAFIGDANHRATDFIFWVVFPAAIFVVYALTFVFTLSRRPSRINDLLQVVSLPLLLLMQAVVVFLAQSRGPELGLLIGLAVFAFAYLLRRRLRRATAVLTVVTLLFGAFLLVFNLPDSPIASWRDIKYIGRLGLLSQLDEGTGKVRTLIWGGAYNLITSDPLRMVIGWGPESMYVAYNKFYPPDLGHWELRNATPDRSHDVFFDQTVTMGLLGLAAYLFIVGSFIWYAVRALRKAPNLPDQLILIGLLSMVVTHVGELITGIQIAATYTLFYVGIACMVVLASVLNNYLAPVPTQAAIELDALLPTEPEQAVAVNGHGNGKVAVPSRVGGATATASAKANGRATAVVVPTRKGAGVTMGPAGNGGPPRRPGGPAQQPPGDRVLPAARARKVVPNYRAMSDTGSYAGGRPAFLVAYVVMGLIAVTVAVGLNVNLVKADMFYKQGLAYDQQSAWPVSIGPYDKAIQISPTEDFYYLFLGRSYMEWARHYTSFQGGPPPVQLLANAESELLQAQKIAPLNTDHYANLGRLYVDWGDSMSDPARGIQGTSQEQDQKYAEGIQQYEKAHSLSPGNATLWNELAVAYDKGGRYQDAVTAIRASQKMDDRYDQTPFLAAEIERAHVQLLNQQWVQSHAITGTTTLTATRSVTITQEAVAAATDYAAAVKLTPAMLQADGQFDPRVAFLADYGALQPLATAYQAVLDQSALDKQPEPDGIRTALTQIQQKLGR